MPSTFVVHHTQPLIFSPNLNPQVYTHHVSTAEAGVQFSVTKESLRSLLMSLKPPVTPPRVRDAIHKLLLLDEDKGGPSVSATDHEEQEVRKAILGKLVVGLYAEALDTYLTEASDVETEAEWWADVERSTAKIVMYLLQTIPIRISNFVQTIVTALRRNHLAIRPSSFTLASMRRLFPSTNDLRPSTLTLSVFPHLRDQPHMFALSQRSDPSRDFSTSLKDSSFTSNTLIQRLQRTSTHFSVWLHSFLAVVKLPFELTRQECHFKRRVLEKIRDDRAEALGKLTGMRDRLQRAIADSPMTPNSSDGLNYFLLAFGEVMREETTLGVPLEGDMLFFIQRLADITLPSHNKKHAAILEEQHLRRPSRLTQNWPRLLLLPPLTLYLAYKISASRANLEEMANETWQTAVNFVKDWLFGPIKDVIRTVRAGGEEGMLISKEGVSADLNSLERMTLSLAQEKLRYGQAELDTLSRQIRMGDLTPVLKIYEEDIKAPVKSAVTGTLLRTLFIQIQKAKVDIDQALSGIDKLLKSQELTFAFVGVAPAFALVYVLAGYLRRLWSSSSGRGRFGGARRRAGIWLSMRRIERLLVLQPSGQHMRQDISKHVSVDDTLQNTGDIPPLTAGLLLLSITQLRTFAETHLPARSRLREGLLEDVEDLEDPRLGRAEKLRVVDRMWRNWGATLGWTTMAGDRR